MIRPSYIAALSLAALLVACPSAPPSPAPSPSPSLVVAPMPAQPAASTDAAATIAPPPPRAAKTTCAIDDDCVATTFPGCCYCCPCTTIQAITREAETERTEACSRKKCEECPPAAALTCPTCRDPRKEGMVARCQNGACVIVETSPPRIACKTVDDCWFDDAHKPIARPANLRGKKITPCKGGGEHAPACEDGACVVRAYKC